MPGDYGKEDITKERYFDLSNDELAMLMSDESMEIVRFSQGL